jgi:photosystem II stability/assembly factor-like uncharacterized protein
VTAGVTTSLHEQPGNISTLAVSHDGGASWSELRFPAGISFDSALQCPVSPTACVATGHDAGREVLLRTADGGRSWSAERIPRAVYGNQLACSSDTRCVGIFEVARAEPRETFRTFVTADGGRSWTPGPSAPTGQSPDSAACHGQTCVLIDQPMATHAISWTIWFSSDGGLRWQVGSHPEAVWPAMTNQIPVFGRVSCADQRHCWAAVTTVRNSAADGALLATSDGGASWRTERLPRPDQARSGLEAVSCPTARRCWAAGRYETGNISGYPILFTTRDAGTTWSRVVLPVSPPETGVLPGLGLISCATANKCVAISDANPDARQVPVYFLRG